MESLCAFVDKVPKSVQWGFAGVGALAVGLKAISYLSLVLGCFILPGTSLYKYGKRGSWAVITGASDGIGKEYATQLAQKGFNLVLVSRTASKLESLAKDLEQRNIGQGLQVKTLAMDFSLNKDSDFENLRQLISGLDVAILINNVGQSHSIPVPFLETETQELEDIININCIGTLKVTKVVAPILKQRKKGLILTMGSFGGWTPTPLLATYSGSKAFLQHWNSALAAELSDYKVDCYLVLSHLVTSAMSKIRRPSMMIPNPTNWVKACLSHVGTGAYQTASSTFTPYWSHAFMLWFIENTVGVFHPITIAQNKAMHVDIRKRALRKAEREGKKQ